jgi:hypothetical protein
MDPSFENVIQNEMRKSFFDKSTLNRTKLAEMKIKELRELAREIQADLRGCIEKEEIVDKIAQKLGV